jgi:F-type H+-transporting ATPase subunit b
MAEPTHTATEAVPPGEHKGAFPPFDAHTFASQLLWLLIAFVALYALMSRWALPRVGAIIENRQQRIAGDVAEAGRLKQDSEAALAAYEKALADARARAQVIANETRDKQAAAAEARRRTLEDELNARIAEAEKSIAATKEAAMRNVRGIAEEATRAIVERLVGNTPNEQAVRAAVGSVLKG